MYSRVAERVALWRNASPNHRDRPTLRLAKDVLGDGFTNVIDVGARSAGMEGKWWRLDTLAGYFGFEPDLEECARLNSGSRPENVREKYFPLALGERREDGVLFVTENPACSSLYQPDESVISRYPELRVAKQTGRINVTTVPLDQWWQDNSRPDVSFIKLDTQGSELDILRGGVDVLKNCVGCEVEVEFSAIYKEQPLFHDVDRFMKAQGFTLWRLYGLCHYTEDGGGEWSRTETVAYGGENRTFAAGSGRLFWANAIYFKDFKGAAGDFYEHHNRKLLLLAALLEGCEEYDGMRAVLRRAAKEGIVSADKIRPLLEVR
jgi:FkbM family methyltransferase